MKFKVITSNLEYVGDMDLHIVETNSPRQAVHKYLESVSIMEDLTDEENIKLANCELFDIEENEDKTMARYVMDNFIVISFMEK